MPQGPLYFKLTRYRSTMIRKFVHTIVGAPDIARCLASSQGQHFATAESIENSIVVNRVLPLIYSSDSHWTSCVSVGYTPCVTNSSPASLSSRPRGSKEQHANNCSLEDELTKRTRPILDDDLGTERPEPRGFPKVGSRGADGSAQRSSVLRKSPPTQHQPKHCAKCESVSV
jgi:hypothetical protein